LESVVKEEIKEDYGSGAFIRDIGLASIAPFVSKLKAVAFIPIITKWMGAAAFDGSAHAEIDLQRPLTGTIRDGWLRTRGDRPLADLFAFLLS